MISIFTWEGMLALFLGGLYGCIFGAIPGLTATLAVALFIPIAFFLDPVVALPAIIAISSVAIYAGDVGASVVRIPGTPASAAYLKELFRLSREKGPLYSLGLSALSSSFGGIIGTILLMIGATSIALLAKQFTSFEYFWIAILGLSAGIFASGGSLLKSTTSLILGMLLATIGVDPTLGYPRFHFDHPDLMGGLNYIVAMIGLFGFSEVLEYLYTSIRQPQPPKFKSENAGRLFFIKPLAYIARQKWLVFRSACTGVVVGLLPGAGADIGSWVATSVEKVKATDTPDEQIILAGTASNNAAVASAWVPALSLGLPGDTITAIVLGVFLMKGISPGPMLFEQSPDLMWSLYVTFLIANIILLPVFGFITARLAVYFVRISFPILLTIISMMCIVGSYAINNSLFDIWLMVLMGVVAFFLKRGRFPLAQVVLGMVLGPILEQNFMVSAIKSKWDLLSFFERPVAILLLICTIGIFMSGFYFRKLKIGKTGTE